MIIKKTKKKNTNLNVVSRIKMSCVNHTATHTFYTTTLSMS